MLTEIMDHDVTACISSLLVFASCSFIAIEMRHFISNPKIKRNWNAFILLTIANAFFHSLTILFWIAGDETGFDLMVDIIYYIDSAVVMLLFTGFFFVQRELWVSFDKIDEAFKVKSAFMHSMSHEMRTPLNAIIGNADMLDQGLLGELRAEQAASVQDMLSSANDLLRMTDAILENTSVTSKHFDIREFVVKENAPELMTAVGRMIEKLRETGNATFVDAVMSETTDEIRRSVAVMRKAFHLD